MATIYEAIRRDHDKHRQLLEVIAEGEGDARRRAWDEFYYDVKSHAAAEEETFYSRLMASPVGQNPARHSVSEHKALDDLMDELNAMEPGAWLWGGKFAKLRHSYEHHMKEEEEEIFAKAHEAKIEDGDGAIATRFLERKAAEVALVDTKREAKLEE